MTVLVVVAVAFGVLLLLAVGHDLYWRRKGFRTEIRGRGSQLTRDRVPIRPHHDEPGGDH
ncbi:hypothetical protein acdb102_00910 [Acidothermaceae bacterium B102]|nr:hypothetical protein acdb102_00910 [Acidothermaceae bacterium B102]